jgi:hypothetical protein
MTATCAPKTRRANAIAWARRKSVSADAAKASTALPGALQDLLLRSDNLYRRIARLDEVLYGSEAKAPGVKAHFDRLNQAFGSGGN